MINGLEFNSANNELNPSDRKEGKIGYIIPSDIDDLLHHVDNFYFMIAFFVKESFYFYMQWKAAADILNDGQLILTTLYSMVPNLAAKILHYLHSKSQAFLQSCAEATYFGKVKLHYLNWDEDLTNLIQGYSHIVSMIDPSFLRLR